MARVELEVKGQKVDVGWEHEPGAPFPCPECLKKLPLYDHKDERKWRHLDTMQLQTWGHAREASSGVPEPRGEAGGGLLG